MKNTTLKIISTSILTSSILLGAVPTISDVEREVITPKIEKEKLLLPEFNKDKKYKAPMTDNGKTILIKGFSFSGNENISSDVLQELTKDYNNKELTFSKISEITASITRYYRSKGYFVARAYIPAQDIKSSNNILEIAIIEGNYGEFLLNNNSLVKDSIVQAMLDDAKNRGDIISTDTLERVMLIINDTPGSVVTVADVKPGKKVGTSNFAIKTEASKAYDGYIVINNTGGRYTGKNKFILGLNANSPFKIGDKLSFSGQVTNGSNLKNGRVAYSVPLMSNGLRGEIAYSKTSYSLSEEYKDLNVKGNSNTLDLTFSYPIKRTRLQNLYASLNISKKDMKSEANGTKDNPKDIKSMNLGLNHDTNHLAFGLNSVSAIKGNYTYGKLNGANDESGANTEGSYSKINLAFSNSLEINPKLTFDTNLNMQYTLGNKNLDGSEDLSLGGTDGVKLYPSGEFGAENGYVLNAELKYSLPTIKSFSSRVGIFYDYGKAFISNNDNAIIGTVSRESLQDLGLGYYASFNDFFGQLQVAWNVNSKDVTSEPNRNSRVLFQGGWSF